jgi:hypothetical protein
MIRHPPSGQVVVLAFEKPRRPISDLVHHGASIDQVIRLDDEAEVHRQPSARRRVRPFVRARMATARAAPLREDLVDLDRVLYGLDAILRLHVAQEEELYVSLGDEAGETGVATGAAA